MSRLVFTGLNQEFIYTINRLAFLSILLLYGCSMNSQPFISKVLIKDHQIDSIINFALNEESNYYNSSDSICGIMRFGELNQVFQIEMVITSKKSFKYVNSQHYPRYYFFYKDFPVFIINNEISNIFFQKSNNKKEFEYPKIEGETNNKNCNNLKPPLPVKVFEPTVYYFHYVDGRIFFYRSDTFMFDQFKYL